MISNSVQETEKIAYDLAAALSPGTLIFMKGDLGAGKTAFVRGLAEGLGIPPETVSSPTYTLVKEYYGGRVPLVHFDMYRIESLDDLYSIGFFDYLNGKNILAVEWSENIEEYIDSPVVTITITKLEEENRRNITVEGV